MLQVVKGQTSLPWCFYWALWIETYMHKKINLFVLTSQDIKKNRYCHLPVFFWYFVHLPTCLQQEKEENWIFFIIQMYKWMAQFCSVYLSSDCMLASDCNCFMIGIFLYSRSYSQIKQLSFLFFLKEKLCKILFLFKSFRKSFSWTFLKKLLDLKASAFSLRLLCD